MKKTLKKVGGWVLIGVVCMVILGVTVLTSAQTTGTKTAAATATTEQVSAACMKTWFPTAEKLKDTKDANAKALVAETKKMCDTLTGAKPTK